MLMPLKEITSQKSPNFNTKLTSGTAKSFPGNFSNIFCLSAETLYLHRTGSSHPPSTDRELNTVTIRTQKRGFDLRIARSRRKNFVGIGIDDAIAIGFHAKIRQPSPSALIKKLGLAH
jgi:hypothetical protein